MKIGIYGGSFNPPHNGHLKLAKELSSSLGLEKVIIIPSNISPQKSHNGNINPLHRINMCSLLFSDEIFEVSDCEISRGGKSYTFDTLCHIQKKYPDAQLFLFMGSDMLLSFHSWYRYNDILSMCTICAISREDSISTAELENYASSVLHSDKVIVADTQPVEVSSSEIREKISLGLGCDGLISEKIQQYIKENNLYV